MVEQSVFYAAAAGLVSGIAAGCGFIFAKQRAKSRRGSQRSAGPITSFVFSGSLKQTSLIDVIQFLEIGRRQGILHIYCGRRKGYLTFIDGKVIDGFYRNQTGREAVFSMLDLREGDFYFEPKKVSQPRLISESLLDLTMEWDSRKNAPA